MGENCEIALLPLGATEQHGPHLPFDTDAIIGEAVASRTVARLPKSIPVKLLPVERVGYSIEHLDTPGTESLTYSEATERWIAVGAEQKAAGIGKFVLVNAHGGNSPLMTIVATELRIRHTMLAVATSWTRFGYPPGLVNETERTIGIHGGFIETSVMLTLRPEAVDMNAAKNFPSRQSDWTRKFKRLRACGPNAFGWKIQDLSAEGVVGNAAAANAEAGAAILDHAAQGLAELLIDVHKFDLGELR